VSGVGDLPGQIVVAGTPEAMAAEAADWLVGVSETVLEGGGGRFRVALSGGSTPRRLHQLLAGPPRRDRVAWHGWEVFFGDERAAPADDPASNYGMARSTLLDLVPIPPDQVHPMEGWDPDLAAAADRYGNILSQTCPPSGVAGAPRLDCILLGLGENGHTASLFPGEPVLQVTDRWAAVGHADYAPRDRITLTFPVLNAAARVAFLVAGGVKGQALREVVAGIAPAARVRPVDGELRWFLDTAAAGAMEGGR
jgi:6-phosphogluconolactonase